MEKRVAQMPEVTEVVPLVQYQHSGTEYLFLFSISFWIMAELPVGNISINLS